MSGFADEMNAAADEIGQRTRAVHDTAVELVKQSIQFGSSLTGAPGQPVASSNLRDSWMREDVSATESFVSTNVEYALSIEDGISAHGTPISFKSTVGGAHSMDATMINSDRLVDAAVKAHGG